MSSVPSETTGADAIMELVIATGDLAKLTPAQRNGYYQAVCKSLGLNPLTRPFEYIVLNGKLTLYARRDATDQLRARHNVSIDIVSRERLDDVYVVMARATTEDGRSDESIGAVAVGGLKGDALANALMKAECVPLDSEILTRASGFRRYDELEIGEDVLAYDTDADACYWTPLLAVTTYESLPMARLYSDRGQFEAYCTADHSWAAKRGDAYKPDRRGNGERGPRGPYKSRGPLRTLVPANELKTSHRIIMAAPQEGSEITLLTPDEAAVLGWAVTDGTIQHRGRFVRVGICQSKRENFAEIERLADCFPGTSHMITPARERTFPGGRTYQCKPQHWWYLPSAASRSLLEKCGYQGRESLPGIVTHLSHEARVAMLDAMMRAEGDKRNVFCNSDPAVLECVQILCALEGIATGGERRGPSVTCFRLKKTRHLAGNFLNLSPVEAQPAWCPTTKYGTWVMRQNGRVVITGNTKAKRRATLSLVGLGWLDETEVETVPTAQPAAESAVKEIEAPKAPGFEGWSPAARKRFWARAGELGLTDTIVHAGFGVDSMKQYPGTMEEAAVVLEALGYATKTTIGVAGLEEALGMSAAEAAAEGWTAQDVRDCVDRYIAEHAGGEVQI